MTSNFEDFAYGHGKLRITSFGIFTYQHGYAKKLLMQKKIGIQNFVPFHHATKTPQAKLETQQLPDNHFLFVDKFYVS